MELTCSSHVYKTLNPLTWDALLEQPQASSESSPAAPAFTHSHRDPVGVSAYTTLRAPPPIYLGSGALWSALDGLTTETVD